MRHQEKSGGLERVNVTINEGVWKIVDREALLFIYIYIYIFD